MGSSYSFINYNPSKPGKDQKSDWQYSILQALSMHCTGGEYIWEKISYNSNIHQNVKKILEIYLKIRFPKIFPYPDVRPGPFAHGKSKIDDMNMYSEIYWC